MLKRIIAVLATATLAIGLALGAALPASAHTGDLPVTAVCNTATGKYDLTAKLNITQAGTKSGVTSWRVGTSSFEGTPTSANGMTNTINVTGDGTYLLTTFSLPGTTTGYGPWVYAHTTFSDGFKLGSDGQLKTALTGNCGSETACINPLSNTLKNFTIVTSGDVTLNSTSHVTGTIAAGGNVTVGTAGYSVGNNEDGSALPNVDGKSTGLLVGGKVVLNAPDAALKVLAGATRVGDTTGAAIKESNRYHPIGANNPFVQMSANASLADVTATGLWNSTFGGASASLSADSTEIANLTAGEVVLVTAVANGQDGKKVKLTEGATNVLRISSSDLAGITKLFFDAAGAAPSAKTPFIIDVTGSGSPATVPVINERSSKTEYNYILWNFSKITSTLTLKTSTGNDFVRGSVLAPNASVIVSAGGVEGQIAAKALTHSSGSEIHHYAFLSCGVTPPKTVTVSTAPSANPPTCTADGSLVIPTQANVAFAGGANGAGPGTYTITATGTNGYTLAGTSSWPIVVKAKGDGLNCEKSTEPTLTVATCDATTGKVVSAYITIPNLPNLSYTIAGVNGGNRLTPGSNVPLATGTYAVNVVGINGYTNSGPSTYPVSIAAFDCNKAVKPDLTVATCDVTSNTLTSAYITIPSTTPGLNYTIAGINNGQPLSGKVDLAAGTYTVNVTEKAGYKNTGPSSFTIVVPQLACEKAVEPVLTLAVCHPTTGAFQSAYITIPSTTPGVTYSISKVLDGQPLSGTVNLPAGTYTVIVTEKAGYKNTGPSSFTIVVPQLDCEKSVEPTLTAAQCDATTGAFTSGFITITSTTPGLIYTIAGINNGQPLAGKVDLAAGTYTVNVSEKADVKNTGATSFTVVVDSLSCQKAEEPKLTVAECDADGKVVGAYLVASSATPGLTYTIHGGAVLQPGVQTPVGAGTYTIDVTTAQGVTNTGPKSFTIKVDAFDCNKSVEPELTVAQCDVTTGPKSAFLTIPTTTPGLIYSVGGKDYAAGAQVPVAAGPYTVNVRAADGYANTGKSSFSGTVQAVDCEPEEYVEPTITPQTCDTELGGVKDGSLLFTLNPDMAYLLDGTPVTTALVSNVKPGTHTITVKPAAGHFIKNGTDTFTVTVPEAKGCDNVYTTPLDPFADPEQCDPFSDTAEKVNGSITVVHVAGIQWYIGTKQDGSDKVAVGTPQTVGNVKYSYAAGDYFVFAESKDAKITIKPGHDEWPLTVKTPNPVCVPTLGLLEADAKASPAVCDAFGDSTGTITILPTPGVAYAIQGGPALTSTTTKVAPGTYTILATATVPNSTLTADRFVVTVAAASALCELTTLAFTGQNVTPFLVIAIILLQAGLVLVAVQFVRARRKARHLAS